MDDKKTMNPMNEDALDEVSGGAANYDYYGNPVPVNPGLNMFGGPTTTPNDSGMSFSLRNGNGLTYACPSCGSTRFKIRSANDQQINLQCKDCGTRFSVANV